MKKSIPLGILLLGMLFALPVHAQDATGVITRFDSKITIQADASIKVVETIAYDFGNVEKHGIFRDIPVSYATDFGNTSIKLSNISVTDSAGVPYTFTTSTTGRDKEIKIGDANRLVTGVKTYVVSYTAERALGYFTGYDELYWNVTGNGWKVPIEEASAEFILPAAVVKGEIRAACYQGAYGSTETCGNVVLGTPGEASTSIAHVYFSSGALAPGAGLTAAVGFPKDLVPQPTAWQKFLELVADNWIVGVPAPVFVGMFTLWYYKGRDPSGTGVVIAEYEAPDSLTPIEMSALMRGSVRNSALSGEIIYLATLGYLSITRIDEKVLLFTSHDYVLKRLKSSVGLPAFDQLLLDGIFTTDEIKLSDLKEKFYTKIPGIQKAVMKSVLDKKYYAADPQNIRGLYFLGGVVLGVVVWFIGSSTGAGLLASFAGVLSGAVVMLFAFIMPKVTKEGAIVKEKAQGLKLYLEVAEKDRIEFHNAPEKNPKLFEKLLPFAMVLGVEAAWAKQFAAMYMPAPGWYSDPHAAGFNSVLFVNSMQSFNTAASSTLTSAPSGGSGSGGGGFSGGGGGGGGGGSW